LNSVPPAKNQMLRFPANDLPEDPQQAATREDARLLALVAEGDQGALAALYRRRGTLIYSLLVRMLVNEMEAQEVLQDAFVRVWQRAGSFNPNLSSPLGWMIMIARGRALDRLRSRSRRSVSHAAYEREIGSLQLEHREPQIERDELAAACATALNELPDEQAHALQLAFFRGWTHEEISRATGQPLGTIKARIRRGLLALRKTFKEYHG
jgi:RNA polymerase sigma-70 factor (ECF subfamily)